MNPNIALGIQQQAFDPAEGQRNALAMQQAQMQQAATAMQLQQAVTGQKQAAARRNALSGVDWNSPDSLQGARTALGGQGDIDGVMAIDKYMQGVSKEQRAAHMAEIDAIPKIAPLMTAPETWSQGRALLERHAPELAKGMPAEYSPEAADTMNRVALGAQGWMQKQNSDREAKLAQDKFAYQKTQDAETNSIAREKITAKNGENRNVTLTNEAGLRKEFTAGAKDFVTVRDAYQRVAQAGKKPTAAGDMAMVYNIMKMFDPNSVVRESEYATAQNAAGVPDQIQNTWNRLLSGERLAPAQRQDFINTAHGIMSTQLQTHNQYRDEISRIASESGIEPSRVIIDYTKGLSLEDPKPDALPSVKIGMTRNGYQFMGGDPTDPNSWRKLAK